MERKVILSGEFSHRSKSILESLDCCNQIANREEDGFLILLWEESRFDRDDLMRDKQFENIEI